MIHIIMYILGRAASLYSILQLNEFIHIIMYIYFNIGPKINF